MIGRNIRRYKSGARFSRIHNMFGKKQSGTDGPEMLVKMSREDLWLGMAASNQQMVIQ
jgi:hypothetical protein